MASPYDHRAIEEKWQRYWREHPVFRSEIDPSKPKFYVLDMFPYPSGAGLHVGHPKGYIATDINRELREDKSRFQALTARIPAGRWGTPEDLQGAAVFLASDASNYCDGSVVLVDGGWCGR